MYKNGYLLFSTKNGNTLTKVQGVPKPIEDYLGLIMYDDVCLNSRSCFEKQIGVQTTGGENYKMFNTVLKSEELATASNLINTDRNKLVADISAISNQITANKELLGRGASLTDDIIDYLKEHDNLADLFDEQEKTINSIKDIEQTIKAIPNIPELKEVGYDDLKLLSEIEDLYTQIQGIKVAPEVSEVDSSELTDLLNIQGILNSLDTVKVAPEVKTVDTTQLENLQAIQNLLTNLNDLDTNINDSVERLKTLDTELTQLQSDLQAYGVKLVKCPDCGCLFNPEEHTHSEV
jgi:chromosome segregation ATPase